MKRKTSCILILVIVILGLTQCNNKDHVLKDFANMVTSEPEEDTGLGPFPASWFLDYDPQKVFGIDEKS